MACEGLALRDRLTTAAANKASVFTEFMGEMREERRQQEGGQDGAGCGSQLPLLEGKNDLGKWDHNGAHRNSRLGTKYMELSFCASWERIQVQFMQRRRNCMTHGGRWTRKGRWADEKDKLTLSTMPVPSTMGWDALDCV